MNDDRSEDAGEIVSERRGAVAWLTIRRPDRLNAFVGGMRDELAAAIGAAAADREARVIVLTGAGRAFSAGADVDAMADLLALGDEAGFRRNVEGGMRVARAITASPKPVLAAVNGVAVGAGAALACACDLRLASDAAQIGFTFNRIGLHPDWGATYHLPRIVGGARAAELVLTARILHAAEALELGLFDAVLPRASFLDEVAARAAELAEKAPVALMHARRSLADAEALEAALTREMEAQMECFRSADVREGLAAFREKRAPRYTGR